MCGIIGQVTSAFKQSKLQSGLRAIGHRGPDANGNTIINCAGQKVWFGHSRLSILDLSEAGSQPMQSRDKRWWVSFNGEIYNHKGIRKEMEFSFRGHSDTETLVEAISLYGIEQALTKFNGMFAFAAFDTEEGKIYLVRDPFGIKPLYVYHHEKELFFCSELRGLQALGIEFAIDQDGLDSFLALRYTLSPQTMVQNIERVPSGHMLTFDVQTGKKITSMFIRASQDLYLGSFDDAVRDYQQNLAAAVDRQLLSDVPVGLLLSGGIDSALVAAMAKNAGKELTGFTVGFGKEHQECEISSAEHTADVLGIPHRFVTVNPEELWSSIPSIVSAIEEPLGTVSVLPMWYLVAKAREEVTVVLTGQGSDEPWGGYRRYRLELLRQRGFGWGYLKVFPTEILASYLPLFITRGLRAMTKKEPVDRFMATYALFTEKQRKGLTGRDKCSFAKARIEAWLAWQAGNKSLAEQMMRIDTRMNLSDDLLLYGDKLSMAVALEARVPMLDIELIKFIESLPVQFRVTLQESKRVHKAMAEKVLPHEIVHRPKKGFEVPFSDWSKTIWKDRIAERLLSAGLPHLQYLERTAIEALWNDHLKGRPDQGHQIFSLLMFSEWMIWFNSLTK